MQLQQVQNSKAEEKILEIICDQELGISRKGIRMLEFALDSGKDIIWLQEKMTKMAKVQTQPEIKRILMMFSEAYKMR